MATLSKTPSDIESHHYWTVWRQESRIYIFPIRASYEIPRRHIILEYMQDKICEFRYSNDYIFLMMLNLFFCIKVLLFCFECKSEKAETAAVYSAAFWFYEGVLRDIHIILILNYFNQHINISW